MNNPVFEIPYTWDRLQDKFQLPDLVRIFDDVVTNIQVTDEGSDFTFDPSPVGLAHGYLIRSANKILCDYVIGMPEPDDTNPNDSIAQIILILSNTFYRKWEQLRDALYTQYNPLSPLDYTDERTVNQTRNGSVVDTKISDVSASDSLNRSGTQASTSVDSHKDSLSRNKINTYGKTTDTTSSDDFTQSQSNTQTGITDENLSKSSFGNKDDGRYGFNADVVSPVTTVDASSTETSLRGTSGKESSSQVNAGLDSRSEHKTDSGSDTEIGSDVHAVDDSSTATVASSATDSRISGRSENASGTRQEQSDGNENTRTRRTGRYFENPQDLIRKEFDARKNNLINTIYQDLDSILCIPVY